MCVVGHRVTKVPTILRVTMKDAAVIPMYSFENISSNMYMSRRLMHNYCCLHKSIFLLSLYYLIHKDRARVSRVLLKVCMQKSEEQETSFEINFVCLTLWYFPLCY